MCSITSNPCSSTSSVSEVTVHPLIVDIVVDKILSHLGDDYQLLNYRLVCHKWNDMIVRKVNKSGHSFQIPLKYGPKVPKLLYQSIARRSANQALDAVIRTLRGTASHLIFDTISIDHKFYLGAAEVLGNWKRLLKFQGEFIRHLKFNNRRLESESGEETFHVKDCDELISPESLRQTFSETPSLETLEFCIKFSNKSDQLLFRGGQIPPLLNLTKMTIMGPRGFSYSRGFLTDLFSMSPNLSTLYIKSSNQLLNFSEALSSRHGPHLVTTLGISGVTIPDYDGVDVDSLLFPFFQLTTLEVKGIHGEGNDSWINNILKAHSSTLVKLTLGSRRNECIDNEIVHVEIYSLDHRHPVIMKTLKNLEINLAQFTYKIWSYEVEFPVLQSLTIVPGNGNIWDHSEIGWLIHAGPCNTLQHLSFVGCPVPNCIKNAVRRATRFTFPMVEYHFDS